MLQPRWRVESVSGELRNQEIWECIPWHTECLGFPPNLTVVSAWCSGTSPKSHPVFWQPFLNLTPFPAAQVGDKCVLLQWPHCGEDTTTISDQDYETVLISTNSQENLIPLILDVPHPFLWANWAWGFTCTKTPKQFKLDLLWRKSYSGHKMNGRGETSARNNQLRDR